MRRVFVEIFVIRIDEKMSTVDIIMWQICWHFDAICQSFVSIIRFLCVHMWMHITQLLLSIIFHRYQKLFFLFLPHFLSFFFTAFNFNFFSTFRFYSFITHKFGIFFSLFFCYIVGIHACSDSDYSKFFKRKMLLLFLWKKKKNNQWISNWF